MEFSRFLVYYAGKDESDTALHGIRVWVSYYEYPAYFEDWDYSTNVSLRHVDRSFRDY